MHDEIFISPRGRGSRAKRPSETARTEERSDWIAVLGSWSAKEQEGSAAGVYGAQLSCGGCGNAGRHEVMRGDDSWSDIAILDCSESLELLVREFMMGLVGLQPDRENEVESETW